MEKALDVAQGAKWRIGAEGTLWEVAKLRGGFDFSRKAFTVFWTTTQPVGPMPASRSGVC